jgi:hypothetical protein
METSMLKYLAAGTLGFALLFGATAPASAGKGRHWIDAYPAPGTDFYAGKSNGYAKRRSQSQPNIELDFETEAVWRNLRPEWFD